MDAARAGTSTCGCGTPAHTSSCGLCSRCTSDATHRRAITGHPLGWRRTAHQQDGAPPASVPAEYPSDRPPALALSIPGEGTRRRGPLEEPVTISTPPTIDRAWIAELTAREARTLDERTPDSGGCTSGRGRPWPPASRRRIRPAIPGRSIWTWPGLESLGCRRQRADRLPQRLRLDGAGPCPPRHRRGRAERRSARARISPRRWKTPSIVSEELGRRFGLPQWRISTPVPRRRWTPCASRAAFTGRDTIVKIFGSYHGHHDYAMVSIAVPYDQIGDRDNYASLPYGAGIPKAASDMTIAVPFNDAPAPWSAASSGCSKRAARRPASSWKPAMMNLGVVLPEPGYLEAVREITRRHRRCSDL